MNPLAKVTALLALVAALTVPLTACKTLGGAGPTPVPAVNGAVDCAAPSLFKVATFATLVPIAEHAISTKDPLAALGDLALKYGEAEATCVAAYLNELGSHQKMAAPDNGVVARRIAVTARWLEKEDAKGVGPVLNYSGEVK